MRLWSLHPKYLDAKGLTACWREGLLARQVLLSRTKGYRHHPQLERFRAMPKPVEAIDCYLRTVAGEAQRRGYRFDTAKIRSTVSCRPMTVTSGQLAFEKQHLLHKLRTRDPQRFAELSELRIPDPHPLFRVVEGGIEYWEKQPSDNKQYHA